MTDPKPFSARQEKVGNAVIKVMSRLINPVYRATGGRIGGKFLRGAPVCLLTTTGRKSGEARTVPLLYMRNGTDVVIVASKGGMPSNPAWYLNLLAHPECTIQIKTESSRYDSRVADPAEKAQLWTKLLEVYPDFDEYQARTERDIPVLVCTPAP
jgi:deazaflavin-dependent oxidoreductase (nitroreductase family)